MIQYYRKTNYGRTDLYIVDQDKARALKTLLNKSTINNTDLIMLAKLGLEFEEVLPPKEQ